MNFNNEFLDRVGRILDGRKLVVVDYWYLKLLLILIIIIIIIIITLLLLLKLFLIFILKGVSMAIYKIKKVINEFSYIYIYIPG